jgi:uncharacterized protein YkwD
MRRTTSFVALALLLALSSTSLNAQGAAAITSMNADSVRSTVQTDMMQTLNDHRTAVGAPAIGAEPRVSTAAQNHANYSSANGYMGHYETSGLPYYTGYGPRDRLIAAGWSTSFVSEVATGGSSAVAGVN